MKITLKDIKIVCDATPLGDCYALCKYSRERFDKSLSLARVCIFYKYFNFLSYEYYDFRDCNKVVDSNKLPRKYRTMLLEDIINFKIIGKI